MPEETTRLAPQFADADQQSEASRLGMWTFLATEVLFFGGLFMAYILYRHLYPQAFAIGSRHTDLLYGTLNTAILLTSSLTMAIGERATKHGLVRLARPMFFATIGLGLTFLIVKGFEYRSDILEHLVPGPHFKFAVRGAAQFWSFYWTVTVVHAIHLTIGLGLVSRMLFISKADLPKRWTTAVGTALYWHLVDIVWVILYPLIYLVGRP